MGSCLISADTNFDRGGARGATSVEVSTWSKADTLRTVIAAGIFTVIVGLATGQGLQEAIDRKVATFHGEVQLRGYQQVLSSDAEALFLSPEDIQRIESQPSFAGGQWFSASFKAGMASANDQMLGAQLMGFDAIPP